jgi:hypothetical protein
MIMGWQGFGMKLSMPFFGYYPGICLEGLGETMRNPSQDSWYVDSYSKQVPFNTSKVLCF